MLIYRLILPRSISARFLFCLNGSVPHRFWNTTIDSHIILQGHANKILNNITPQTKSFLDSTCAGERHHNDMVWKDDLPTPDEGSFSGEILAFSHT